MRAAFIVRHDFHAGFEAWKFRDMLLQFFSEADEIIVTVPPSAPPADAAASDAGDGPAAGDSTRRRARVLEASAASADGTGAGEGEGVGSNEGEADGGAEPETVTTLVDVLILLLTAEGGGISQAARSVQAVLSDSTKDDLSRSLGITVDSVSVDGEPRSEAIDLRNATIDRPSIDASGGSGTLLSRKGISDKFKHILDSFPELTGEEWAIVGGGGGGLLVLLLCFCALLVCSMRNKKRGKRRRGKKQGKHHRHGDSDDDDEEGGKHHAKNRRGHGKKHKGKGKRRQSSLEMAVAERSTSMYGRFDDDEDGHARPDASQSSTSFHLEGADDWEELIDDDSGCKYWYNHETGDTTWEKPASLMDGTDAALPPPPRMPPPADLPPPPTLPNLPPPPTLPNLPPAPALRAPQIAPPVVAALQTNALPAPPPPPTVAGGGKLPPGWEAHEDEASGVIYFFNGDTGETQWEAPVA